MAMKFTNNASATLAASISSSSTSITVTTGQGALFPALGSGDYFYATLFDSSNHIEIIKVTARSGDTLTAVRGQDSTTARAFTAADKIELRATAAVLNNFAVKDTDNTFAGANTFSGTVAFSGTGGALPVASGGTGVITSTGTGAGVHAVSPSLSGTIGLGTNFTVVESGTKLYFKYGATTVASLDSLGNLIVLANVTAYGTP